MKRLGTYHGRTVNVIINDSCSNSYEIIDNGKHIVVDKSEVIISDRTSITLDELGGIMGIPVCHM